MKISTQIVDAIRNIQKQKVSWFSICMIVALGIASYLGTIFAADAIKQAGQGFYDETSFRDIQLVSTLLFSDEDLKSVEELDGVEDAEGLYQTTAVVQNGSRNRTVQVQSLTERVSVPIVLDGRLPKKPTECVMEATLMDRLGLAVGDSISLLNTKGNTAKYLIQPNYVIVGRVLHPDHITARLPENLYVLVQKEAFNPFETFQSYMRAEVRVEDGRRFNTFEADYFRSIEGIQEELGNIGVERSKLRDTIIWGKLKEMEAYLRDARNTYNAARRLLVLSENGKENADSLQKRNDELWHSFAERIKQDFGIDVMYLAESYAKRIDQSLEEANEALTEFDRTLDRTEEQYRAIRNMVEQVGACRWFSFDRRANAAFVDLSMVADSLQSLAMSFSMLFIVVGALVCYATIGRMADEQRSLIGAEKALGFFEGEIFRKYLIFGASGVGLGIGAGIWLGYYGMQSIICQGYADMYVFGEAAPSFVSDVTIVVTILGLLLAAAAAFFACHRLLSRTATVLMKGEVVKRDWKRILITAVSVGGCMALLVIGFSLKFAVDGVMDKQYGEIVKYDKKIRFNPDASVSVADDIEKALSKAGADYLRV
ncbi:MAG: hypothetical protein IJV04_03750, partial [Lachnospiraceae bacterium]|nr:hypothetical protein [Lachnospiraceae bacterium]